METHVNIEDLDGKIRESEAEYEDAMSQRAEVDQRIEEIGKQRGRLSSRINQLNISITRMKSQAYDALKASQHPAQATLPSNLANPAPVVVEPQRADLPGTRKRKLGLYKAGSSRPPSTDSDSETSDDSDVEEVPRPVKREISPIRVSSCCGQAHASLDNQ
jgi:hypothetical protein